MSAQNQLKTRCGPSPTHIDRCLQPGQTMPTLKSVYQPPTCESAQQQANLEQVTTAE